VASDAAAIPVWPLAEGSDGGSLPEAARRWMAATGFEAKPGRLLQAPAGDGSLAGVILGIAPGDPFAAASLASDLPAGTYRFAAPPPDPRLATLGFLLGRYRFDRYRKNAAKAVRLVVPAGVDGDAVSRIAEAVGFT